MPKSYQPGQRNRNFGQNYQISEERYAWIQCELGKFMILVGEDKGHGPDVVLYHPKPGKMPDVSFGLTNLTLAELDALKDIFDSAFEWAKPVVERRDKEAQDAWDQGDDSHVRNYRPLPTVVYRKRPELQYSEGVHDGPSGVSESDGGGQAGGVRGTGSELVEPLSSEGGSEDDSTPLD